MRLIISGEQPFQILGTSFGVSASESDYTILYSIDGQTYTTLKSVSAGENVNISGRAIGTFYKLSGNTSTVEVVYGKTCEEIAGVGSINGETGEISLKTINGNSIIGEGNIDIEGGEGKPSFYLTANEDSTAIVEDENLEALKAHFISGGTSKDINVFLVLPNGDETMFGTSVLFINNGDGSYFISIEFPYVGGGRILMLTWSADEVIENTIEESGEATQIVDDNNVLLADRTFSHSDPEDASQNYFGTVPVAINGFFDRFVQITQEEYDALGDDVNEETIYIIKD